MQPIIEVKELYKTFGDVTAVDRIDFHVNKGSLFSFLGSNGAGKSTTISILLTLLKPDAGKVIVNGQTLGQDDHAIRKEIGVVFQDSLLDPLLTAKENLDIRGRLYGMNKSERLAAIERVAAIVDIHPILNRRYGKLSGGQKRRVDIARSLLHQPALLILDEPTTGLDPQNRKQIWQTILQLQKETNLTIFLTTHYIEEAAGSNYVVIMKDGRIIGKGTPEELKNRYSSDQLRIMPSHPEYVRAVLQTENIAFTEEKKLLCINLHRTTDAIPILAKAEQWISSFEVRQSSLDDVFITINNGKEAETDDRIR